MAMLKIIEDAWDSAMETFGIHALPEPLDRSGVCLNIPGVRQADSYSCGVAAAFSVLKAFNPSVDMRVVREQMKPDRTYGVPESKVDAVLRKHGLRVTRQRRLTWNNIKSSIDRGSPIILIVDRPGKDYTHWVVLYGYAEAPNSVYVAAYDWWLVGKNKITYTEFRRHFIGPALLCAKDQARLGLVK